MNTTNCRGEAAKRFEMAFIELIQSKDISGISVSDICRLAGVSRTTFYVHYTDIYDLAEKARRSLEKELVGRLSPERSGSLRLLQHIKDNQGFYRMYFKLSESGSRGAYTYDVNQTGCGDERRSGYHAEFFNAGFNAVVRKWVDSGCAESPEEILEVVNGGVRNL